MENNEFPRATGLNDPERCKANLRKGPCTLKALPGGTLCLSHGGALERRTRELKDMRNYRLAKFQVRATELGNSDHLTSLKDEVALVRLLIEEMVNSCENQSDLLLRAGPLSDLLMKCEKVVTSCHKLDSRLGNLLDKQKVIQFAQMVVEIISSEIENEDMLNRISTKILKTLEEIQ